MLIHLAQIKNSINLNSVENIVHWCSVWEKPTRNSTLLFRMVRCLLPSDEAGDLNCEKF